MKFIILGSGSSMGVPRPDGFFGNCDPKNKKNYRTRCSALISSSQRNILIFQRILGSWIVRLESELRMRNALLSYYVPGGP